MYVIILVVILVLGVIVLLPPGQLRQLAGATPTTDPAIYNQVPKTTVFEPGECTAVLDAATPSHTSNTLGGEPSGEIPPGKYEVGVAARYSTSLWYGLNNVGTSNYVNSNAVSALEGNCSETSLKDAASPNHRRSI